MRRMHLVGMGLVLSSCQAPPVGPAWQQLFGYADNSMQSFEIRAYGFPFVPIAIGSDTFWVPFDTGNMVGLTIGTEEFSRLGLPCSDRWDRVDSGGQLLSSGCTAHGVSASAFGTQHDSVSVFEFFHENLPGLVGPGMLPGTRFTLDYGRELVAVDEGSSPDSVLGFAAIPLVRSSQHPRLILAYGRLEGHDVLLEIDTGKSRTTIDRALVESLGLEETPDGAQVGEVSLGSRTWSVSSARVVDTSGISRGLPSRISLGVGSDVLAGFVFTVDYSVGRLWIERRDERTADHR